FSDDDIYYYYDESNHRFIVEWDGVFNNDNTIGPQTTFFQAILLDPEYYKTETGDGEIIIQYKDIKITDSNTIGIEDDTELIGLQYVCDAEYVPTASILKNETAIKFTTEIPLITASVDEDNELTKVVSNLEQNIPNPFKFTTSIGYEVLNPTYVSIIIYNNNGALVKILHEGNLLTGKYSVVWDGTNEAGIRMNSGIYFYRLITDNSIETKKLFMVK
ncbi:MAG: T9SS type A sorting domain-containing protein, partial [Bacteroidetes bacterium]|nr:T9SS type A sorting domain-containing protein [Bacteroidota bacterium]